MEREMEWETEKEREGYRYRVGRGAGTPGALGAKKERPRRGRGAEQKCWEVYLYRFSSAQSRTLVSRLFRYDAAHETTRHLGNHITKKYIIYVFVSNNFLTNR